MIIIIIITYLVHVHESYIMIHVDVYYALLIWTPRRTMLTMYKYTISIYYAISLGHYNIYYNKIK